MQYRLSASVVVRIIANPTQMSWLSLLCGRINIVMAESAVDKQSLMAGDKQ